MPDTKNETSGTEAGRQVVYKFDYGNLTPAEGITTISLSLLTVVGDILNDLEGDAGDDGSSPEAVGNLTKVRDGLQNILGQFGYSYRTQLGVYFLETDA